MVVARMGSLEQRALMGSATRCLKILYNKQKDFYKINGYYSNTFESLKADNYMQDELARYTLYMDKDVFLTPPPFLPAPEFFIQIKYPLPGYLTTKHNDAGFIIYAVGNIDNDPALDIWMITEKGNLIHLQDDRRLQDQP